MKKNLAIAIVAVTVLFIAFFLIKFSRGDYSKHKFCLFLTTCYNRENYSDEDKRQIQGLYNNVIRDWLHNTELPIAVVDSSGHKYPEFSNTRLIVSSFIFRQSESSTISEANSMLYALDNCKELSKYEYLVKITGKYYIPFMEHILSSVQRDHDFYVQNRNTDNGLVQNSEVFAFRYSLGRELVTPIVTGEYKQVMEARLGEVVQSGKYTYTRFPPMINYYSARRGDTSILRLL
jgi:hypothetical protein